MSLVYHYKTLTNVRFGSSVKQGQIFHIIGSELFYLGQQLQKYFCDLRIAPAPPQTLDNISGTHYGWMDGWILRHVAFNLTIYNTLQLYAISYHPSGDLD